MRAVPYDSATAADLIAKALAVNEALYGHPDQTPVSAGEFSPANGGLFLVAYLGNTPVACGAYRRHADDPTGATAEIKRMYVEPAARRRGVARAVLAALEQAAAASGYQHVILDTGSRQYDAHALYESSGYRRTAGFSIYRDRPGNRAYTKRLRPPR